MPSFANRVIRKRNLNSIKVSTFKSFFFKSNHPARFNPDWNQTAIGISSPTADMTEYVIKRSLRANLGIDQLGEGVTPLHIGEVLSYYHENEVMFAARFA